MKKRTFWNIGTVVFIIGSVIGYWYFVGMDLSVPNNANIIVAKDIFGDLMWGSFIAFIVGIFAQHSKWI